MIVMSISIGLDEVTTEQKMPLGTQYGRQGINGQEVWIYAKNSSGGAYAAGDLVARKDSVATYETQKMPVSGVAGHAARAVGFAQWAVPDGSFAMFLRDGVGLVRADTGGVAANTALKVGDAVAGTVDGSTAVTDPAVGHSILVIAGAATGLARVHCIG